MNNLFNSSIYALICVLFMISFGCSDTVRQHLASMPNVRYASADIPLPQFHTLSPHPSLYFTASEVPALAVKVNVNGSPSALAYATCVRR